LAPHDVLDYVVVHEVCHLVEHHHGPEFWRLVERRRPNYRESKEWLDNYGWGILGYRPPSGVAAEHCVRGAVGELRLLRDADRLGCRRARGTSARVWRIARCSVCVECCGS